VVRRELEKRLNRYDAFEELTDSDIVFPVPSKKALAWVLGKMVVYDRYAMQAFWKSPVFDEGVLILDQQEDVMAMKIQSAWRLMVARGKLFQKIKTYYRKMWDKEYQSFYYFNRIDETRSWELPMLLYRTNRWDLELIDIWDKVVKEDGAVWYFNGARDQWSRFSEAKCVNIIAAFYRKHVMGSACTLPSLIDLAKGMKFKDLVLDAYEKHPEKLSALVNMALYTHTRTHQYKTARQLYAKALKLSDANPTILYSVGLFELADRNFRFQESRWEVGMKYIADARELDHRRDKFATAEHMFFKMGVIIGANDPRSLRNWALVHQCIKQDYTTADKLYCRSLALDPYDEGTQVCYVDFLDGFKNGGIYDRSGPPISLKMESTFVREEVIDGVRWQLFANPKDYSRAHHKFWYNVDQARTRWVSPKWKARGFLEKELQIMKAKRRIVSAENRYRKEESRKKAKSRDGGGSPKKRKQRRDSSSGNGPASPAVSNGDEESEQPQRSADYIPIPDEDEEDDRYEGGSLAELLGAAPGSPIHHELTNMQQMLSTTSQRLMQLEAAQSNQPTVDELERLKSMVEEQNARIAQLMAATNMSNDPKGVNPDNAKQPGRDY
jgi:tetratricopeptide (TPR) repeat protein